MPVDESPYTVALRLEPRLRKVIARACGYFCSDPNLIDEAWSDVVLERAPRVCELFNAAYGVPLDVYFVATMRRYVWKWIVKKADELHLYSIGPRLNSNSSFINGDETKLSASAGEYTENNVPMVHTAANVELSIDVQAALSQLTPYEQWLIRKHDIEGYTFEEMQPRTQYCRAWVAQGYWRAAEKLRKLLKEFA